MASMSPEPKRLFRFGEVESPRSQYMTGMNRWLEQLFPEYCPPRFDRLLVKLRRPDSRHQIQIFLGLVGNQVAGLVQLFYREWHGGLLADIDLLGVLEPFRRSDLGLALVQQSLRAAPEMARHYQMPAIGVTTLIDPLYVPIVRLHQKLGGQIRADYPYPSGDLIVWYPMQPKYADIATLTLGDQLRQFGRLLEC